MNRKEQELIELMAQLEAVMRREMMSRFHTGRTSMNPHRGQGRIMSLLKLQPEISQKELSYLLDMSKQGLAELLAKLETAGYITRTPSTEDGRVMVIRLTEKGRQAAEDMNTQADDSDSVFSCLNEEEQKNLKEYMQRMIAKAEKQMPEGMNRRYRRMQNRFSRREM